VRRHFSDEAPANVTVAIAAINGGNRLAIGFRAAPGSYQPAGARKTGA
jgi:alkylhydroperoxidase family enzyme